MVADLRVDAVPRVKAVLRMLPMLLRTERRVKIMTRVKFLQMRSWSGILELPERLMTLILLLRKFLKTLNRKLLQKKKCSRKKEKDLEMKLQDEIKKNGD